MYRFQDRVGLWPTLKRTLTHNYSSGLQTDTNIRWLNVEQVKYCSLLFTFRPGRPLISNPSPNPSDNTSWWTHCMEFYAAFSRCVVNPYCTLEQTSLQRGLQRVSEGDRSAEGEGVDCRLARTLKTKEKADWRAGRLAGWLNNPNRAPPPKKKKNPCAQDEELACTHTHTVSARFAIQVKSIKWM